MSADLAPENSLKNPEQVMSTAGAAVTVSAGTVFDEAAVDATTETPLERVWNRVRNYGFSIAGCNIVLPTGLYSEVLIDPAIAQLPNSPAHFVGLTNVRGNLVPVYRLELWLERQCPTQAVRYAILIDDWSRGAALVIDAKPQALNLADYEQLSELPKDIPRELSPMIEKVYALGGQYWYLINHHALFAHLSTAVEETSS